MMNDVLSMRQAGNLFVYTLNNPLRFIDPTGLFVEFFVSFSELCCCGGGGAPGGRVRIRRTHNDGTVTETTRPLAEFGAILSNFRNPDGSFSLHYSGRTSIFTNSPFSEHLLRFNISGPNFDLTEGGFGLFSIDGSFYRADWSFADGNFTFTPFRLGNAQAGLTLDFQNMNLGGGAMVSIWSPQATIGRFTFGAEIGGAGGYLGFRNGVFTARAAKIFGFNISIDFNRR